MICRLTKNFELLSSTYYFAFFKNNGMEEVELRWWRGAQVFNEGYKSSEGQVTFTTPGFQDALDDLLPSDAVVEEGLVMGGDRVDEMDGEFM